MALLLGTRKRVSRSTVGKFCWKSYVFLKSDMQETDKATMEVEAQDDGVLAKIIVRTWEN